MNTLELLQAEKESTASASVQAISREVALPLDDIITDATTVLDRYAGHDDDITARLRHLLYRAREIRGIIHKVGSSIVPQPRRSLVAAVSRLAGTRLLVVDSDEAIRRSAHHLLGVQGAVVETARDGHEAVALMRRRRIPRRLSTFGCPTWTVTRSFTGSTRSSPRHPSSS